MTEETILKVLREIQASVPKHLRDNVVTEELATPDIKMVVEKALEDPDFPEEKKKQLLLLQENGYFDKKRTVENKKVAAQIDAFVKRKIREAVKEGRLPNRKQLKKLNLFQLHEKNI
jgi:hypothetical protein